MLPTSSTIRPSLISARGARNWGSLEDLRALTSGLVSFLMTKTEWKNFQNLKWQHAEQRSEFQCNRSLEEPGINPPFFPSVHQPQCVQRPICFKEQSNIYHYNIVCSSSHITPCCLLLLYLPGLTVPAGNRKPAPLLPATSGGFAWASNGWELTLQLTWSLEWLLWHVQAPTSATHHPRTHPGI